MKASPTKILVIVGPTASGKTALAVRLAKTFNGEVISADSRQVYRELDLGTGKVTPEEADGVPHHLIDVADPTEVYNAADFVRDADCAIADISARGKLPIVAGGTFFYIEALLGTKSLAEVPANEALRAELDKLPADELFARLKASDPEYADTIDRHNIHRLIRAIEIVETLGTMPRQNEERRYEALILGADVPREVLNEKIRTRLLEHLSHGMLDEAKRLHKSGLTYERMESLGLEYRYMARHLQGALSYEEMVEVLTHKIRQFAKRQRTWLKKMKDVQWFAPTNATEIESTVRHFLT